MNERIKAMRKAVSLTQTEFANRLGLAQNTIAAYESGKRSPNDAIIRAICKEFNVNEQWLREGEGSIFVEMTRDEIINQYLGELVKSKDPEVDFQKRFVRALANLSVEEWKMIESFVESINKKWVGMRNLLIFLPTHSWFLHIEKSASKYATNEYFEAWRLFFLYILFPSYLHPFLGIAMTFPKIIDIYIQIISGIFNIKKILGIITSEGWAWENMSEK